jgi:hypothetical protein
MPGCVLRATGDNFQPHKFLEGASLAACNVFRKGYRKAENLEWDSSGFTVVVSEAPDDNFSRQIEDAIEFLQKHKEDLARLRNCAGLEDVRLDFGVGRRSGFLQSSYLPPELLTLAGELGIGIEISIYGEDKK